MIFVLAIGSLCCQVKYIKCQMLIIMIIMTIMIIMIILLIMIIFNVFIRERQDVAWGRLQGMVANEQGRKVSQG